MPSNPEPYSIATPLIKHAGPWHGPKNPSEYAATLKVPSKALKPKAYLHDCLIVPVDQVADRLNHTKLDVIINLGHLFGTSKIDKAKGQRQRQRGVRCAAADPSCQGAGSAAGRRAMSLL